MKVYVGRQPIFNRKLKVFGYELLYRRSKHNFFEGLDDTQATAELINNAFFVMHFNELTHGTKAFINFSSDLIEKEIPLMLPRESVVVEILERVLPTDAFLSACRRLKEKGYLLALDDFVAEAEDDPLVEMADIIKMELSSLTEQKQQRLLETKRKGRLFLAEKIETREEFNQAREFGFDLFQGFFFSKPVILEGKEIQSLNVNLLKIIDELNRDEPEFRAIADVVERDLALSYKLFRVANSIYYGPRYEINSVTQALARLGLIELKKWVYLMMVSEVQNDENHELVKNCLVRGKLMEYLALELGSKHKHMSYFVTGLFSSMDTLLNRDMDSIVDGMPLPGDVKAALLGAPNEMRRMLEKILMFESGDLLGLENSGFFNLIPEERFMKLYTDGLKWMTFSQDNNHHS